jgi:hypothetical protein
MLMWLRTNGCPWDGWACIYAALRGHLDVLTWMRANGCPWHNDTCRAAVRRGHLDVLVWARANGCPWDSLTCASARVLMGAAVVLVSGDGISWAEEYYVDSRTFAQRPEKTEAVVEWLRSNGCPD